LDIGIYVCFAIAFAATATGLASSLLSIESAEGEIADLSFKQLFIFGSAAQLGALLGWFAFHRICRTKNSNSPADIVEIIATSLATIVLVIIGLAIVGPLWIGFLNLIGYSYEEQEIVSRIREGGSNLEMALMGILIILIAPICEEIAYRGTLYRFANGKMPDWLALALPSALFSASHANVYAAFPLFILGIVLNLVYKRTGSLITPIIVHALFNSITFVGLLNPSLFGQ
ncbi:MAG: type II CAAX endopeptidase family protein, partial [Verrucomicrobiota bacterium]